MSVPVFAWEGIGISLKEGAGAGIFSGALYAEWREHAVRCLKTGLRIPALSPRTVKILGRSAARD
jgi:hypothetical protein